MTYVKNKQEEMDGEDESSDWFESGLEKNGTKTSLMVWKAFYLGIFGFGSIVNEMRKYLYWEHDSNIKMFIWTWLTLILKIFGTKYWFETGRRSCHTSEVYTRVW